MTDVILTNKRGQAVARTKEIGQAETLAKHYRSIGCAVTVRGPNCLLITGKA